MATAMTSYREASWTKSRTFEITPDSVIVRNWGFAGRVPESEVILLLAELSPQVSGRSWMKGDDQHTVLFGISAFLGIGAVTWLALSAGGRDPAWLSIVPGMLGALVLVACIAVFDPRRVEYLLFNNKSAQVVLSVGRLGPEAGRCDEFVAALQAAIASAGSPSRHE